METKTFFASKLNWLGMITFVAGLASIADLLPAQYQKFILVPAGIAVVALRTFGTTTAIAPKQPPEGGTGAS